MMEMEPRERVELREAKNRLIEVCIDTLLASGHTEEQFPTPPSTVVYLRFKQGEEVGDMFRYFKLEITNTKLSGEVPGRQLLSDGYPINRAHTQVGIQAVNLNGNGYTELSTVLLHQTPADDPTALWASYGPTTVEEVIHLTQQIQMSSILTESAKMFEDLKAARHDFAEKMSAVAFGPDNYPPWEYIEEGILRNVSLSMLLLQYRIHRFFSR